MFIKVTSSGGRRYAQLVESYRNESGQPQRERSGRAHRAAVPSWSMRPKWAQNQQGLGSTQGEKWVWGGVCMLGSMRGGWLRG